MGGFSTVIGFIFSFFVLIFVFVGLFFLSYEQVNMQSSYLDSVKFELENKKNENVVILTPFISSGRLSFIINNDGNAQFFLKRFGDEFCLDFFVNNNYVLRDSFLFNRVGNVLVDYRVVDIGENMVLTLDSSFDVTNNFTTKLISCFGNEYTFYFDKSKFNWWDLDWRDRLIVDVENNFSSKLREYQIEIILNSSNFKFYPESFNDLRVFMPFSELIVLDLNFDLYQNNLIDNSNFNNTVYLGQTSSIDGDEPEQLFEGVFFSALNFDGNDNTLRVEENDVLNLSEEFSISFWMNRQEGGVFLEQTLYDFGGNFNSVNLLSSGNLVFNLTIDGVNHSLMSDFELDFDVWNFLTLTYDGVNMSIYLNGVLDSTSQVGLGKVHLAMTDNYIGSFGGISNFYRGYLDEFKVFSISLTEDEVLNLFHNNLKFRELNFYVSNWDLSNSFGRMFVKVPFISLNSNSSFHIYYNSLLDNIPKSDIENTFSYNFPRLIGFPVSQRLVNSGLSILSMYDDNELIVGDNVFSLNRLDDTSVHSSLVDSNTSVLSKKLVQVEGSGATSDMIVPISWAGTQFVYDAFRGNLNRFCIVSPFGNASVDFYIEGVFIINELISNSNCISLDIPNNNQLRVESDIPVLISYDGENGQDSFVFYPATSEPLFGIPSNTLRVAVSNLGGDVQIFNSQGVFDLESVASDSSFSLGGNGPKGTAPAFKLVANNPIGAVQQADGDGSESTTFVPEKEMGVLFGSSLGLQYLTSVSPYSDANCTLYDGFGNINTNIVNGVGGGFDLYKYDISTGSTGNHLLGNWLFSCEKPVWLYYEKLTPSSEETNLFGHLQMRQFVYPPPQVSIRN